MDKESGVYITITDNSFETNGNVELKVGIPMVLTKGKMGLNRVTADDFKQIVGYDVDYNPNYIGLSRILEQVSYADVWRINQNAKLANAYFTDTASDKQSSEDAEDFKDIENLDPKPILAVSLKDVGKPADASVKFTPIAVSTKVENQEPNQTSPQTVILDDASFNEVSTYLGQEIKGGCVFYNALNNQIIGIIKPNYQGELSLYKVIDGEVLEDEIQTTYTNIWNDGTHFLNSQMEQVEEPEGTAGTPVEIGTVRESAYDTLYPSWLHDGTILDENIHEMEQPSGTAGTSVLIGYCFEMDGELFLSETQNPTSGTSLYQVTKLGATFADCTSTELNQSSQEYTDLITNHSSEFTELDYVPYTEIKETGMYQKNGNDWFKVTSFSTTAVISQVEPESNQAIIDALDEASDIAITYNVYEKTTFIKDNRCGLVDWQDNVLTVTLINQISREPFWYARTIPSTIKDWTLTLAYYENNQYKVQKEYNISTDSESDIYWKNLTFDDINLYIQGNIKSNWEAVRNYFSLDNGSNGDTNIVSSDIDTSVLETCGWNVIATNGITSYNIINKITVVAEKYFIHVFADAPAYENYLDLEAWAQKLYRSEYLAIGARPDRIDMDEQGRYKLLYPSVNYIAILSKMLSGFGNLNYPPAGFTYGPISVQNLIDCNYELYGDELKTNRINWQRLKNQGAVMWEQRTTYALNSDLSYIAPIFIIDSLRQQLVDFETLFAFRYASPTDLINQESGIRSILDNFVTSGFIYDYQLKVPTFEEAQKAGRTLTIEIGVAIMKDSEVININININNA